MMEKIKQKQIIKTGGGIHLFEIYGNGLINVNGRIISFDLEWNKNRHILGIMATLDNRTRLSDRLN